MIPERLHAVFSLTVESEDIEPGKIAVRDLTHLSALVQQGLDRTARVLSGLPGSAPGKLPKTIEDATRLVLTGIGAGSAVLQLELPEPEEADESSDEAMFPFPALDLGFRAMDRFVRGLHVVEESPIAADMPEGWDNSVMDVARGLAETAEERSMSLTFDARPPHLGTSVARITPQTASSLKLRRSPVRRRRTARGHLVAVDLGTGRVEVQEVVGGRVSCHYEESMVGAVRRLLGTVVVASGEADFYEDSAKFGRLELDSLEVATEQMGIDDLFWLNLSAEEQAARQGTEAIGSLDELAAPGVFTDDDFAEFLTEIKARRG